MKHKFVTLLLMTIILVTTVSAFQFDNTYNYDEATQTAIIHNCDFWVGWCLNEGEVLATAILTSGDTTVHRGEDVLVGQFNFSTTGDFNDVFNDMYLTDMRNNQSMSRGKQYKYKKYTNVSVDDYETVCENVTLGNQTVIQNCTQAESGSHYEIQMDWIPIVNPTTTFYSNTTYEIGVFVDVEGGDYGDWRPQILGVQVPEWSTWTESLYVGLVSYYKLDETTGAVVDFMSINDGTNIGATRGVVGKINNAFDFEEAENDTVSVSHDSSLTISSAITYSFWIKLEQLGINNGLITKGTSPRLWIFSGNDNLYFDMPEGDIRINGEPSGGFVVDTWYHIIATYDKDAGSDNLRLYVNGVSIANGTDTDAISTNSADMYFGSQGNADWFMDGIMDEIGIWNRTVTTDEVAQLYNDDNGISPEQNTAPSVTLILPVDDITESSNGFGAEFVALVTDQESDIDNCTLSVWNITDDTLTYTQTNTSIVNNTNVTFNQVLMPSNYTWNINCTDNESLTGEGENNFTINIIPILDAPTVTLNSPIGGISLNDANVAHNFTITAGEVNTANWTLNVWFSNGTLIHQDFNLSFNISGTETIIHNDTFLFDEDYIWTVESCSNLGTCVTAPNETFSVDTVPPQINITAPIDNFVVLNGSQNITVNYTITHPEGVIDSCWLNTSENATQSFFNCSLNTSTLYPTSAPETLTIYVTTNDTAGNIGTDNVTILKSTVIPVVNITAPVDSFNVTQFNETIDLNWTVDTNGTLDSCWYTFFGEDTCYQESANESNQGGIDGDCGQDYSGSYSIADPDNWLNPISNLFDGDWSSFNRYILALSDTSYTVNYTKPSSSPSGASIIFASNTSTNVTIQIPESCYNFSDSSIAILYDPIESGGALPYNIQCFDGTWNTIGTSPNTNILYEEGIIWNFEKTFVTCTDETTTFNYPTSNPDNLTVFFFSNDTLGNLGSDSVTILKSTIAPQISITSPVEHYALLTGGQSLDLNFSVTNSTTMDQCWYSYNGTNTTVDCLTGNETNFTYVGSLNTITVYSNNTLGNVNSTTRTWTVDSTENSFTYNSTTFETKTETFILNITINESTVVSVSSILNYNNTRYTATSTCEGQFCILETAIDIPLIESGNEQSNQWFYEVTLFSATSQSSSNSTIQTQNITKIFFDVCNATLTTETLNFTAFDEQTLASIDPFIFNADFEFWLGTGSVTRETNISNSSTSSIQLCISPATENFEITGVIEYDEASGANYTIRNYYFQNDIVNNISQDIGLGLLLSDQSTSFILKIQDADILPLSEALIFTERFYPGTNTFRVVQVGKTDDNGKTVGFFEAETGDYRFIIKKDGVTLLITPDSDEGNRSQKVVGEEAPFTLTFTVGEDEGAAWEEFEETDSLTSSLSYNTSSQIVSFAYEDTSGDFTSAFLEVYKTNATGSDPLICNETLTQSSGILTCNMTGNSTGSYISKGIIYRGSTRILAAQEVFNIQDFSTVADRLGLFLGWFIILIAGLAFKFNEIAGIILINAAMIFVNVIGLVNFGATWITAWIALSIIILVVLER